MNKNISKPAVFIIVLIKVKREDLVRYKLICWSKSTISFHCYLAKFINLIILRVIAGFYPKKYAIIYYKCEPRTVKRYLSITAMNESNIIWLK